MFTKENKVLTVLFCTIATAFLAGCGNQPQPQPEKAKLTGIDFDMGDKNYTYTHGDDFFAEFDGVGRLIPDIYACYSDGSKKLLSNHELENVTFTGFQQNTIAVQPIVVQYTEEKVTVTNSYKVNVVCEGTPIIDIQPRDQFGRYPEGKSFTIKVRNSQDVKYQWLHNVGTKYEEGKGLIETYGPLEGISATTDTLIIPSTDCLTSYSKFACDVTSISKNITVRSEPVVYFNSNTDEFIHCAYMGEYAITAGSTLDLANTPYGSGTISLAENGLDYTFTNVKFKNDKFVAGIGVGHEAFALTNYNNTDENLSFTFIGENVIDNVLWDDEINSGGTAFNFNFLGDSVKPTLTFKGPGTLEIIGGTNAIHTDCGIEFDVDLKLRGEEKRLTKGIICRDFTLKENRKIEANLGGAIIFTEGATSTLTLENGSKIIGNINVGKVKNGGTLTFGISSSGYLKCNNATIDLDINVDTDYIAEGSQYVNPLIGINVNNVAAEITGSTIDIDITATNDNEVVVYQVAGISSRNLGVDSSTININIDSDAFLNSYAISAGDQVIIRNNSVINAEVKTLGFFGGINASQEDSSISIQNSKVTIKGSERSEGPGMFFNVGLKADSYIFDLGDEGFVDIDTVNGFALASNTGETTKDPATPVPEYEPQKLKLENLNVTFDKEVEVNLSSYYNGASYVTVETLYLKDDLSLEISKIKLTKSL